MSREDVGAIFSIVSILFVIAELVDRKFFFRERFIESLIKDSKKRSKCLICDRPLEIISQEEAIEELQRK